jgi:hypothetical protein
VQCAVAEATRAVRRARLGSILERWVGKAEGVVNGFCGLVYCETDPCTYGWRRLRMMLAFGNSQET